MTTLAQPLIRLIILLFIGTLSSHHAMAQASTCSDFNVYKTGTPVLPHQAKRMLVNAEYPENRKISKSEKIRKIKEHMQFSRYRGNKRVEPTGISDDELAELIVDVVKCTGHDFSIFAGLLRKESDYCLNKRNTSSKKSTAAGCGQFTVWPVREFKNQLLLPGRTKKGTPAGKKGIETLLSKCFGKNSKRYNDFIELYSKKENTVKEYLRSSNDYEMDLVSSAIFLKFYYGIAGFYYSTKKRKAGALSLYGEGTKYARLVNGFANKVQNTNYTCIDDIDYIKEIEQTSCELTEDPASCSLTTETFDI